MLLIFPKSRTQTGGIWQKEARKIFRPKKENLNGELKEIHNENVYYFLVDRPGVKKSLRMLGRIILKRFLK